MKNKKFMSMLLLSLLLVGCQTNENTSSSSINNKELSILTPTNAPALAFIDQLNNDNYSTNSKPNNIALEMIKGTHDIVVVDLIGGLTAIEKQNAPYKLASVITFGNFYIYATGNDENKTMENEDNIICFGQNTTPDILFKHLYPDITVDTYLNGVADVSPIAASGVINNVEVDYCVIAEPVLYNILHKKEAPTYGKGYEYSSFQELWKNKHANNSSILGASIYIKNDTYKDYSKQIDEFLDTVSKNINRYISNPEEVVKIMNDYGSTEEQATRIGINSIVAKGVLENNSVNLGFLSSKADNFNLIIEEYLNVVKPEIINENNYL